MFPAPYQLPWAFVLVMCGIVACFFGYRFFRIVLAVEHRLGADRHVRLFVRPVR